MATKRKLTLLQQQKAKLRKQRALASTPKAKSLIDQRINRVQVQIVDTTKALKGSPPPKSLPAKSSATPPARDGGLPRNLRKYLPQGRSGVSARRAQAAAKQQRAADGTRGTTTQTGSQSPASIRRELRAVKRAQAEIGRNRGGPLSAAAGVLIEQALSPLAESAGHALGSNARRLLGGGEPTKDKNGKPIKRTGLTAAQRAELKEKNKARIAKIKKESDAKVKAGRNDPKSPFYKAPSGGGGGGGGRGGGGNNTPSKAPSKKSAASTFRDKRDTKGLKIGRAFTLKEHEELVKERKRKKSAAEKAGYPGQRNY